MVVGQERGPLVPVRPTNRDQRGQTKRDQCPNEARQAPWPHAPGPMPPWVPVRDLTGTNELIWPERKSCFLLVNPQQMGRKCQVGAPPGGDDEQDQEDGFRASSS